MLQQPESRAWRAWQPKVSGMHLDGFTDGLGAADRIYLAPSWVGTNWVLGCRPQACTFQCPVNLSADLADGGAMRVRAPCTPTAGCGNPDSALSRCDRMADRSMTVALPPSLPSHNTAPHNTGEA